ncbi:MAG TPA: hypothetical protein VJ932_08255, partial [Alkalispirochaeta sp.]|nr:hypothetical protein [Alkalispirochaeta sp.]
MKNRLSRSTLHFALAAVALIAPATTSVSVAALTFDDVIARLEATITMQEGQAARDVADDRLALAQFAGDPRLTLTPSTTISGAEGDWSSEESELR